MIFLVIVYVPPKKGGDVVKKFFESAKAGIPKSIKKWQTFVTPDGLNGMKGYHLIFTDKERVDEAYLDIGKIMAPFGDIEGLTWKVEVLSGVKDMYAMVPPE